MQMVGKVVNIEYNFTEECVKCVNLFTLSLILCGFYCEYYNFDQNQKTFLILYYDISDILSVYH